MTGQTRSDPSRRRSHSARMAQVCAQPLLMETKLSSLGASVRPLPPSPQQTGLPSSRSAQACRFPAETTEKASPAGGDAWPKLSKPQQCSIPSRETAQAYLFPALTDVNFRPMVESNPRLPMPLGISCSLPRAPANVGAVGSESTGRELSYTNGYEPFAGRW